MKKTTAILCTVLMLVGLLAGCASNAPTARITGLSADADTFILGVDENANIGLTMTAEVTASDGAASTYALAYGGNGFGWPAEVDETIAAALSSWAEVNPVFDVADESIATVENGAIFGHKSGETTITTSVIDPSGETVSLTLAVTVIQYVESLDVNVDSLELTYIEEPDSSEDSQDKDTEEEPNENKDSEDETPANTATIVAKVWPENSTDNSIIFESSDESIVTVDEQGVVIATGVGEVDILVSAPGAKEEMTHTIKVNVTVPTPAVFAITEGKESVNATSGKGFQFPLDLGDENPEDFTIIYESSDTSVVAINESGWCDAIGVGEAELTASVPHTDLVVVIVVVVTKPAPSTGGNQSNGGAGSGGNGSSGGGSAGGASTGGGDAGGSAGGGDNGGGAAPPPAASSVSAAEAAAAALGVGGFANYSSAPGFHGSYAGWSASSFGGDQAAANQTAINQAVAYSGLKNASSNATLHCWSDGANFYVAVVFAGDAGAGEPGGGRY